MIDLEQRFLDNKKNRAEQMRLNNSHFHKQQLVTWKVDLYTDKKAKTLALFFNLSKAQIVDKVIERAYFTMKEMRRMDKIDPPSMERIKKRRYSMLPQKYIQRLEHTSARSIKKKVRNPGGKRNFGEIDQVVENLNFE
jgi:hypothetical protein